MVALTIVALPLTMAPSCNPGPVTRAAETYLDDAARVGRPLIVRGSEIRISSSQVDAAADVAEGLEMSRWLAGLESGTKKQAADYACKAYDAYEVFSADSYEEKIKNAVLAASPPQALRLRVQGLLGEMKPDEILNSTFKAGQFSFCESVNAWS